MTSWGIPQLQCASVWECAGKKKKKNILKMQTLIHVRTPGWPASSGENAFAFSLEASQIARDASANCANNSNQHVGVVGGDVRAETETGGRTCGLAAPSAKSSVFALQCQQVKVGDSAVWCCQTEFLPPNFTPSSRRLLSRLQSPPSSLLYLSLLTLIHCSRALQFKALGKKNCNPNSFLTRLPPSAE